MVDQGQNHGAERLRQETPIRTAFARGGLDDITKAYLTRISPDASIPLSEEELNQAMASLSQARIERDLAAMVNPEGELKRMSPQDARIWRRILKRREGSPQSLMSLSRAKADVLSAGEKAPGLGSLKKLLSLSVSELDRLTGSTAQTDAALVRVLKASDLSGEQAYLVASYVESEYQGGRVPSAALSKAVNDATSKMILLASTGRGISEALHEDGGARYSSLRQELRQEAWERKAKIVAVESDSKKRKQVDQSAREAERVIMQSLGSDPAVREVVSSYAQKARRESREQKLRARKELQHLNAAHESALLTLELRSSQETGRDVIAGQITLLERALGQARAMQALDPRLEVSVQRTERLIYALQKAQKEKAHDEPKNLSQVHQNEKAALAALRNGVNGYPRENAESEQDTKTWEMLGLYLEYYQGIENELPALRAKFADAVSDVERYIERRKELEGAFSAMSATALAQEQQALFSKAEEIESQHGMQSGALEEFFLSRKTHGGILPPEALGPISSFAQRFGLSELEMKSMISDSSSPRASLFQHPERIFETLLKTREQEVLSALGVEAPQDQSGRIIPVSEAVVEQKKAAFIRGLRSDHHLINTFVGVGGSVEGAIALGAMQQMQGEVSRMGIAKAHLEASGIDPSTLTPAELQQKERELESSLEAVTNNLGEEHKAYREMILPYAGEINRLKGEFFKLQTTAQRVGVSDRSLDVLSDISLNLAVSEEVLLGMSPEEVQKAMKDMGYVEKQASKESAEALSEKLKKALQKKDLTEVPVILEALEAFAYRWETYLEGEMTQENQNTAGKTVQQFTGEKRREALEAQLDTSLGLAQNAKGRGEILAALRSDLGDKIARGEGAYESIKNMSPYSQHAKALHPHLQEERKLVDDLLGGKYKGGIGGLGATLYAQTGEERPPGYNGDPESPYEHDHSRPKSLGKMFEELYSYDEGKNSGAAKWTEKEMHDIGSAPEELREGYQKMLHLARLLLLADEAGATEEAKKHHGSDDAYEKARSYVDQMDPRERAQVLKNLEEGMAPLMGDTRAPLKEGHLKALEKATDNWGKRVQELYGEKLAPAEMQELEQQGENFLQQIWKNTCFLSINDFQQIFETSKEHIKIKLKLNRRWAQSSAGQFVPGLGDVFLSQQDATAGEEVNRVKGLLEPRNTQDLYKRLESTGDLYAFAAICSILSERGDFDVTSQVLWSALERVQESQGRVKIRFYQTDAGNETLLLEKLHSVFGALLGPDELPKMLQSQASAFKGRREKYVQSEIVQFGKSYGPKMRELLMLRMKGEYMDPALFDAFMVSAIPGGASSPAEIMWFIMQGVGLGIITLSRLSELRNEMMGSFPQMEWFTSGNRDLAFFQELATKFPPVTEERLKNYPKGMGVEAGGPPPGWLNYFYESIVSNENALIRMIKDKANGADHDSAQVACFGRAETALTLSAQNFGGRDTSPLSFHINSFMGELSYVTGLAMNAEGFQKEHGREYFVKRFADQMEFMIAHDLATGGKMRNEGGSGYTELSKTNMDESTPRSWGADYGAGASIGPLNGTQMQERKWDIMMQLDPELMGALRRGGNTDDQGKSGVKDFVAIATRKGYLSPEEGKNIQTVKQVMQVAGDIFKKAAMQHPGKFDAMVKRAQEIYAADHQELVQARQTHVDFSSHVKLSGEPRYAGARGMYDLGEPIKPYEGTAPGRHVGAVAANDNSSVPISLVGEREKRAA